MTTLKSYAIGDPCPTCAGGRIGQSQYNFRCANCGWLGPRIATTEAVASVTRIAAPDPADKGAPGHHDSKGVDQHQPQVDGMESTAALTSVRPAEGCSPGGRGSALLTSNQKSVPVRAGEAFVTKFKREPTEASDCAWMNGYAAALEDAHETTGEVARLHETSKERVWLADYAETLEKMANVTADATWRSIGESKAKEIRAWLQSQPEKEARLYSEKDVAAITAAALAARRAKDIAYEQVAEVHSGCLRWTLPAGDPGYERGNYPLYRRAEKSEAKPDNCEHGIPRSCCTGVHE